MADEGDMRQMIGELIATGESRGKQMDRIEKSVNNLAEAQAITREWVIEGRATVRALKWGVSVLLAGVGALGLDWWSR